MNGRIRPGVWMAAAAALVAALAILRLALPAGSGESTRQPTSTVSLDRSSASSAVGSIGVHPTAALLPSSSRLASERVDARREVVAAPRNAPQLDATERLQAADSRVASDLRIIEEEAARRVESLGLMIRGTLDSASSPAADSTASDDARRTQAADEVLVDYLVQDANRGTEFPIGFPAEQRTRAAAESQVRGLTPELRQGMLEVALQTLGAERGAPTFDSTQIWEGAIY